MKDRLSSWRAITKFIQDNKIDWRLTEDPNPQYPQMRFRYFAASSLLSLGYGTGHGETLRQAALNFAGCFAHLVKREEE